MELIYKLENFYKTRSRVIFKDDLNRPSYEILNMTRVGFLNYKSYMYKDFMTMAIRHPTKEDCQ